MTYIFVAVILALGAIFIIARKKGKEEVNSVQPSVDVTPVPEIEKVEEKVEKVVESVEEVNSRLEKIASVDIDKPFAKISTPDVSEIPNEIPKEIKTEAPKRTYKKRANKKSDSSKPVTKKKKD